MAIKRFSIPSHSTAWYNFRRTGLTAGDCKEYKCDPYEGGIGASEMGTVLGLNKWRPVLAEIFHHKVGTETPNMENNAATVNGLYDEEKIQLYWSLYDGTERGVWDNVMKYLYSTSEQKKSLFVRKARRVNAYLVNSDYPYLSCSLDYFAQKGTPSLEGVIKDNGFPVECKTLNGYYAKQWEGGIPEYHIVQANQQMIITETDYAEIPVLIDGRQFIIYPVNRNEPLCTMIIEKGKEFWDKVLEGRKLFNGIDMAYKDGDMQQAELLRGHIDSMEPEPDDTEAYEQYMKERYYKEQDSIIGTVDDFDLAVKYKLIAEFVKLFNTQQQEVKNILMRKMEKESTERITFEQAGYLSFQKSKNAKYPTFRNYVDFTPNPEALQEEIDKINLKRFV